MDSLIISTGVVALGEIGDKTQLLAILLAARFHKPFLICFGILIATLANHALAGFIGVTIASLLDPATLKWVLGISFILIAFWLLIPDKIDDKQKTFNGLGVLLTTVIMFFLAEMGDKTQIATVALAARFDNLWLVITGSTLGMMLANIPAVYLGDKAAHKIPTGIVHKIAAAIFIVVGVVTLIY